MLFVPSKSQINCYLFYYIRAKKRKHTYTRVCVCMCGRITFRLENTLDKYLQAASINLNILFALKLQLLLLLWQLQVFCLIT